MWVYLSTVLHLFLGVFFLLYILCRTLKQKLMFKIWKNLFVIIFMWFVPAGSIERNMNKAFAKTTHWFSMNWFPCTSSWVFWNCPGVLNCGFKFEMHVRSSPSQVFTFLSFFICIRNSHFWNCSKHLSQSLKTNLYSYLWFRFFFYMFSVD